VSYRWVEHTAELELELDAPTAEGVFADALVALAELLSEDEPGGDDVSVEISLRGEDRALLLADWLDELVFVAETQSLVPVAAQRIELDARGLSATVSTFRTVPSPLVKGITHHRLAFEPGGSGFRASVVLDV
jgi:SHS2 domain-containing protein